jgi:internalin A
MDYKAFVSSTFEDLKDHRALVIAQLDKAGFHVAAMERWTSSTDVPKEFSRQRLEGCHLCVLLIGRRRGFVPDGEHLSITQLEYAEAKRRKIDILPFVLDDHVADWPAEWDQRTSDPLLAPWRGEVLKQHGVEFYGKDPASLNVAPALANWVKEKGPKVALEVYLESVKQQCGSIEFVSLPLLEDHPNVPIQRLYVEPAVADRWVSPDVDPEQWPATTHVLDALAQHPRLVLLGDPGSGKSTLVHWVAWQLAAHHDGGRSPWTERLGRLVPLPIVLRDLHIGPGITWEKLLDAFMQTAMGRLLTLANVQRILSDGRAMIMLDGLDEIGNPAVRRDLRDAVWQGMGQCNACRWLLTSRVVGYDEVAFHEIDTEISHPRPSLIGRQFTLIAELRYAAPFDDARVDRFAHNWFVSREKSDESAKRKADELLDAVREDPGTKRLGRVPILLTMMALIFRNEAHLPNGRALLCNKIAEAYLYTIERWRRIDDRNERLEERRRWLARVGFEMQRLRSVNHPLLRNAGSTAGVVVTVSADITIPEVFATEDQVRGWIADAMRESKQSGDAAAAQDFVDYLGRRTGLLLPRGEDQFAFLHLSFQEYFAAYYLMEKITTPAWATNSAQRIAPGTGKCELKQYASETVWRETLLFLAELLAVFNPAWLTDLYACLFGPEFADVNSCTKFAFGQAVLLARLAIDPQAGFSDQDRQYAIQACCRWEARK